LYGNSDITETGSTYADLADSLNSDVVDVCGILMQKTCSGAPSTRENDNLNKEHANLVITDTTYQNLHTVALNVAMSAPVLLEGPAGSGKTSLVEELARFLGSGKGV
jgi:midasin